ncbi:hypothetical protein ACIOJE_39180 [Kitasatospora sp. NPDC087861]|uniref:hypothetical protein n=1 Tax=Kitasatospora sp. NPDC087861 TaxID=3364070 RepID=UPI0037F92432
MTTTKKTTASCQAHAAATADDAITKAQALAALSLIPGLRADLDAAEVRITDTARTAGATWNEVGTVLGMTKQSAAECRNRLNATTPGNT